MNFEILLRQLHFEINEIENKYTDILKRANFSIVTCRVILSKMNHIVSNSSFDNEAEEVNFFKNIKVFPLSKLVYYSEVRSFEIQYPKVSIAEQKKYLEKKIKKINKFFDYNIEFIQYVKEERTHLDAIYYTRKNSNTLNITNTKTYYRAPDFSTSHDILLGKVKAYESFINYLENKLFNIQNLRTTNLHDNYKKSKLRWTSSKTALTELVYGLHGSGATNAEINEIATAVEELFNINLGNYYRTFSEIKIRKSSRTIFLDKMKNSLEDKMDEADE